MYQRIMNSLDAELFMKDLERERVDNAVGKRIKELTAIMDGQYGRYRGSFDMGGYLLFFHDSKTYDECYPHIMQFYHLNKELFEYSEKISTNSESGMEWWEELYLISSEDALILLHPKENAGGIQP